MAIVPEIRTHLESAITALQAVVDDTAENFEEDESNVGGQQILEVPTDVMVGALMFILDDLKAFDFGDVKNELHHLMLPKRIQWNHRQTTGYDLTDLVAAIA